MKAKERRQRQEIQGLIGKLRAIHVVLPNASTFFYPSAGFDWNPLLYVNDCFTFVYCNYGTEEGTFQREIDRLPDGLALHHIERVRDDMLSWELDWAAPFVNEHFGEYVRLVEPTRPWWGRVVVIQRENLPLRLFYLKMEGFTAYVKLFLMQSIAPKVMFLTNGGFEGNWTEWNRWDRPLGRAVANNPKKRSTQAILVHEYAARGYDWPWNTQQANHYPGQGEWYTAAFLR